MKEYEAMVKTYSKEGGEWHLLEEWSGSELFTASTESEALRDAVYSLKREHEQGLVGNPFNTIAETWISEDVFKQGWVTWNVNDTNFVDVVEMKERSE